MPVNPYFAQNQAVTEQALIDDLTVECIQIHGLNLYYVPREILSKDLIFGEATITQYTQAKLIEMYIKSADGWTGEEYFISRFGMEIRKNASIEVSIRRFFEETGKVRPNEGDLIYFPTASSLMVIKDVGYDKEFYQIGKNYTFTLICEMFEFNQEKFATGNNKIDEVEKDYAYQFNLVLTAGGTGTFNVGDVAYQGASTLLATVLTEVTGWNASTRVLTLKNLQGVFDLTAPLVTAGGASWHITTINNLEPIEAFADNTAINAEVQTLLDKTGLSQYGDA